MNTPTKLNAAAATLSGYSTEVKVGSWSKPRKLFVNYLSICLEVKLGCTECSSCQSRHRQICWALEDTKAPHIWKGRWLILTNLSNSERDPLEYLQELFGMEVVEITKKKGKK